MTDDDYARHAIRAWIRSGFYTIEEVGEMLEDILEESDDEAELQSYIVEEFTTRNSEMVAWPTRTDCDRLDDSFASLRAKGIVALQNAGYTMSDGHSDVGEILAKHPTGTFKGYCFYHGQDVERVVDRHPLLIAFGDLQDTSEGKLAVGRRVCEALVASGLRCEWDETPEKRIEVHDIEWKRRAPPK